MSFLQGLSKIEMRLFSLSLLGLAVCSFLIANESALSWLNFKKKVSFERSVRMGRVLEVSGEININRGVDLAAEIISPGRELFLGEAFRVPPGSRLSFELETGQKIIASDNSYFRFSEFSEGKMVSFDSGVFRMTIDGSLRIGLNGEATDLRAHKAEVQIRSYPGGSARVEALSGEVQVIRVRASDLDPPKIVQGQTSYIHIWKFEDLYEKGRSLLLRRGEPVREISLERQLMWTHVSEGPFSVQISRRSDFSSEREFLTVPVPNMIFHKFPVGELFVRVSADHRLWSEPAQFVVEGRLLSDSVVLRLSHVSGNDASFSFLADQKIKSFVLEISEREDFPFDATKVFLIRDSKYAHAFTLAGTYYARARGFNDNEELTEFSQVSKLTILPIKRLPSSGSKRP